MSQRILYTQPDGTVAIIVPASGNASDAMKDIPEGAVYEVVNTSEVPSDRTFRNAWVHDISAAPEKIVADMPKAQGIAHDIRREKRAEEFAPHDEIISKQIPGADSVAAEASRSVIRTKYDTIQTDIDLANDEAGLKSILTTNGLV